VGREFIPQEKIKGMARCRSGLKIFISNKELNSLNFFDILTVSESIFKKYLKL
jgi:hypothetical protein